MKLFQASALALFFSALAFPAHAKQPKEGKRAPAAADPTAVYDMNANGKIDGGEIEVIKSAFDGAKEGALKKFDTSADGKLDDTEIAAITVSHSPAKGAAADGEKKKGKNADPNRVRTAPTDPMFVYDVNKNGKIDADESQSVKDAFEGFKKADANSDGKLDDSEIGGIAVSARKGNKAAAGAAAPAKKGKKAKGAGEASAAPLEAAAIYDSNGNGKIDGAEVDAMKKAFGEAKEGPLKKYDTNSDGSLDDTELGAITIAQVKAADSAAAPAKKKKKKNL